MLQDMAKLRDFDICGPRHIFFRKDAAVIKPSTTLYFAADSGEALPDFIQSPIPLVSDMVKKVLDVYEDDMIFRSVSLVDKSRGKIFLYHTLLLEEQEMLSDSTEYYPNGSVKRLVLDRKKSENTKFFWQIQKSSAILLSVWRLWRAYCAEILSGLFPGSGGGVNGRTE